MTASMMRTKLALVERAWMFGVAMACAVPFGMARRVCSAESRSRSAADRAALYAWRTFAADAASGGLFLGAVFLDVVMEPRARTERLLGFSQLHVDSMYQALGAHTPWSFRDRSVRAEPSRKGLSESRLLRTNY